MIQEVQRVYRLQGVEINDKHVRGYRSSDAEEDPYRDNGDTEFLPGTLVDVLTSRKSTRPQGRGQETGRRKQVMLGITKASLATNSFLSAASFQETTKVLTEAAIKGKVDPLIGLKENVLLGKLIPAGTGMKRYRTIKLDSEIDENEELTLADDDDAYLDLSDGISGEEADEDMAETEETAVETVPEEAEDDAFDGESEDDTTDEN